MHRFYRCIIENIILLCEILLQYYTNILCIFIHVLLITKLSFCFHCSAGVWKTVLQNCMYQTLLSVQQEVLVDVASIHFLHCVLLCFVPLDMSLIKPFLFTKYAQCLKSSALWMGLWLNINYSMQHNSPAVSCCIIPNPLYARQVQYSSNFHPFNSGYWYKVTAHIE